MQIQRLSIYLLHEYPKVLVQGQTKPMQQQVYEEENAYFFLKTINNYTITENSAGSER